MRGIAWSWTRAEKRRSPGSPATRPRARALLSPSTPTGDPLPRSPPPPPPPPPPRGSRRTGRGCCFAWL
eukprot:1190361-Rhodomonas_salina.1